MKHIGKTTSVIVTVSMLLPMLAACSSKPDATPESSGKKSDAPTKIVFMTTGDVAASSIKPDDRIVAEINKRLGIDLTFKVVPEGAYDKINVAMATGDIPDIVTINYPSNSLSQWIKEGLLVPINDYLKDMPTVKERLESKLSWTAVDGKYYGYPFLELEKSNYLLGYRADWLESLGLQPPKTLDEFRNTLKETVAKDPDKKGAYGFTTRKPGPAGLDFIFYAYGMPYGDWALDDKQNVIPKFEHPAFKKGMTYIKQLWDEKLLDPEFMLNDLQMKEQKFYQGKAGFMDASMFRHVNRIETSLQKVNPKGKLGYMAPPAGPEGKAGMVGAPKTGLFTAVTKGAKNPEKAAKFIEFMLSKEGRQLLELGIENVHYTKQGDKITYNEAERAKDSFAPSGWSHPLAWGSVMWPLTQNYLPQTEPQADRAKESVTIATKYMVPNLVNVTTAAETEFGGVVNELQNQYFMNMLTGKIDIDAGIAELSKKWRDQGGNKILQEVTAAYKAAKK
ncbi:extracellular solute-binding protein [Paenibacillus thalictri]|uniref:Extracellular solute-binding protein n=1 Tax=Paenibacillus thalictri TaxID=2527873 RepID=A0A4Q9DRJ5_9BACL|nr:extracellular solute-binding protein [Paenibacillus thalictri]TBL78505.1 extracellular solute-binding protein [Paenibacillus thalictri]